MPVAFVYETQPGQPLTHAGLTYYAVSKGFHGLYSAHFEAAMEAPAQGPEDWRGADHLTIFPDLTDSNHEWHQQLDAARKGTSSGWNDVAWNPRVPGVITVAYQLTAVANGCVAIEAVDLAKHAARIIGGVPRA